jgi:peptidoglycan lytic transglycosylase
MISGPARAGFALLAMAACGAVSCGKRATRVSVPAAPARIGSEETGIASWYGIPYHGRRTASGEIYDMEKLTAAHRSLPFQTWVEVTNLENGKRVDVRITDRGPFVGGRIIDLSQRAARDIEMLGPGVVKVRLKVIEPPRDLPPPAEVPASLPGEVAAKANAPSQQAGPYRAAESPRETATLAPESGAAPESGVEPQSNVVTESKDAPAAAAPPSPAIEHQPPTRTGSGYAVQAGAFAERERAEILRSKLEAIYMDARVVVGANNLWRVIVGRQMTEEQAGALAMRVRRDAGASLIVRDPE